MIQKNMKQNIIYIRTSTEEQNPENQLQDCKQLATKLNIEEYEVLSEQQSAFKDIERQVFSRIQLQIKAGNISSLIVWDLDRLFRNRKKLIEFFQFCKIYNCKIYSVRQDWLESINKIQAPFNEIMFDLMLSIMGWLAEEESSKKSMRVKLAVRKKEGEPTKSYKGNKWGRKSISTQKINLIKELRNKQYSIRAIAQELNLSIGVVHKTIKEFIKENSNIKQRFSN